MDLSLRLRETMLRDRHRLARRLRQLEQEAAGSSPPQTLFELPGFGEFKQRLDASTRLAEQRLASLPPISIPSELPIAEHASVIADLLRQHQVLIVCGETGSGKSTQLPKIGLQAGFGRFGLIGHTQPRRIAARSVAARLAEELGTTVGAGVGFKVRFTDRSTSQSWVKLMTDGILLAETQGDPWLNEYDLIIVDEAHERSLNIDFLLGYLHRLLQRRPELRVIITSATLDADRFARHFGSTESPAPIVSVAGRTYPVEVRYRDPEENVEGQESNEDSDWLRLLEQGVRELWRDTRGDMLVFLATEADIRAAHKRLRSSFDGLLRGNQLEILPLYARLSVEEQNRVFRAARGRRIVLATNVAESSLTVPGIMSVIDLGTARISRYSPRSKVQRLPIEPISRASADQRAGRCGRIAPGICLRLYGEQDYLRRDAFTTPEIRRTDLATVILRTESLKLGRVDEFPFLDPPHGESIRDGYRTLFELGGVDDHRRLTDMGKRLATLPVHPRVGRMLLAADEAGCLTDMLIVASGLEIQDVRERPVEQRQAADEKHRPFQDERSDFVSLLKLWDFQHSLKESLTSSAWRKALVQNFLSIPRVLEWMDLHRQLLSICQDAGLNVKGRTSDPAALHRSLLTGLLSGVAQRTDKGDYIGAGGLRFHLWPGSGLANKRPEWIMTIEIVETSRRFGRTAAAIDVRWIEPLAEHLISRSYSNPRWSNKAQAAMTDERVSLFGLTIVRAEARHYATTIPTWPDA
ncbi:MAG: ATP-dependent RNA helicase HrpA [Pirellulaceae bacterium]